MENIKTTHEKILEVLKERNDLTLQDLKEYFTSWIFDPIKQEETKNHIKYGCPACGNTYSVYKIHFSQIHLDILKKIFVWCAKNKVHEFHKREIPNLSHTEYWNFCFLQRFGFLYFLKDTDGKKVKGGYWGMPMKRVYKFLNGEATCSKYFVRNTATGHNIQSEEKITAQNVKNFANVLDPETLKPAFLAYEINEKEREEAAKLTEEQRQSFNW